MSAAAPGGTRPERTLALKRLRMSIKRPAAMRRSAPLATGPVSSQTPQATNEAPPRVNADDGNTACLRTLKYLRRRTKRQLAGRGFPPREATTTRPGNWVLVGEASLIDDPEIRWYAWCQAGSRDVGLRVQTNRVPAPPARMPG